VHPPLSDRPANPSPRPLMLLLRSAGWILVAVLLAVGLLAYEWSWSIPEVIGYSLLLIVSVLGVVIVLAVVYSWLARLLMGPHYLALVRLRQVTHDQGRQHACGQLTAAFFGPSNIEATHASRAQTVLACAPAIRAARRCATRVQLGMAAQAEIKTGRRRIIQYLLSPISQAMNEAGRQR
jgi:hypothetical protein